MRLVEIGEQPSIKNYSIMKNAVQLVNTFGGDFPSELKPKLDIIIYKILRSMSMQQDQQPVSNIHHYYHEQKDGQDLFSMVKYIYETLHRVENSGGENPANQAQNNNEQQQSKDIDSNKTNEQQPAAAEQQQGDSTTQQDAA
jgi:hypothetical protein